MKIDHKKLFVDIFARKVCHLMWTKFGLSVMKKNEEVSVPISHVKTGSIRVHTGNVAPFDGEVVVKRAKAIRLHHR